MSDYTVGQQTLFPFGLRELRVKVSTTNKALSPAQTCQINEEVVTAELTGDDAVVAAHSFPQKVSGTITAAGMPLAAYALMTGRTISTAGATPTRTSTLTVAQGDAFPYFTLYGRAVNDDGTGDTWFVIYKCKLTQGNQGQYGFGEFKTSQLTFTAIPDSSNSNKIWDTVSHETVQALPTS